MQLHTYKCAISVYNLHAHIDIGVRGGDQILAEDQLPAELESNVCNRYHDGDTDRASEDESVRITCETYLHMKVDHQDNLFIY